MRMKRDKNVSADTVAECASVAIWRYTHTHTYSLVRLLACSATDKSVHCTYGKKLIYVYMAIDFGARTNQNHFVPFTALRRTVNKSMIRQSERVMRYTSNMRTTVNCMWNTVFMFVSFIYSLIHSVLVPSYTFLWCANCQIFFDIELHEFYNSILYILYISIKIEGSQTPKMRKRSKKKQRKAKPTKRKKKQTNKHTSQRIK